MFSVCMAASAVYVFSVYGNFSRSWFQCVCVCVWGGQPFMVSVCVCVAASAVHGFSVCVAASAVRGFSVCVCGSLGRS